MTYAQLQNRLTYGLIAIAVAVGGIFGTAIGAGLVYGFRDGEPMAPVRIEVASAIALMVAAGGQWVSANRPRDGSEGLAADVGALHAAGYHRKDLTVVPKPGATPDA